MKHIKLCLAACLAAFSQTVFAGELVYQPINPSFGGDPLYSNHLYQGAEIANTFEDTSLDGLFEEDTAADEFVAALQSTLIAGSAAQIATAIFENGAPPSGAFTLDTATVNYSTVGSNVIVSINDGVSTKTLTIPKPPAN